MDRNWMILKTVDNVPHRCIDRNNSQLYFLVISDVYNMFILIPVDLVIRCNCLTKTDKILSSLLFYLITAMLTSH